MEPTVIAGALLTETFPYDGGRAVTVYVPPTPAEVIVYAGDGQLIAPWGSHLEAAGLPATMIVGVHRTSDPDEMVRIGEYSPSFEPARFAAHERFFVDEVGGWVRSRFEVELPRSRTVIAGVSAGAELALALGLRHPETHGVVFAASPGAGYRPPEVWPARIPRTYLTAGTLEPFFRDNARRWLDALAAAGADVVMTERIGGHGDPFWPAEFVAVIAWACA